MDENMMERLGKVGVMSIREDLKNKEKELQDVKDSAEFIKFEKGCKGTQN